MSLTNRKFSPKRRVGKFESLERREMMTGNFGSLQVAALPTAPVHQAVVSAPALASATAMASATGTTNYGLLQGIRSFNDRIDASNRQDNHSFYLDEQSEVAIQLHQMTADLDLYLYNSAGSLIASSRNGGAAVDRLVMTLGAGNYTAVVLPYGAAQSAYNLYFDSDVGGESLATARNVGSATSFNATDWVGPADAHDYYRFVVNQQSQTTLRIDSMTADLDLYLYNSAGQQIAVSNAGGANADQIQRVLAAGTYYARVAPYSSNQSHYRFTLNVAAPTPTSPTPAAGFQIDLNMTGLTASQQNIVRNAANRWQQVITGDLPNTTWNGQAIDDLLIHVYARSIDGTNNTLANAGPDAVRPGTRGLPSHGVMNIDTADLARMEADGSLFSVIVHEIGHVLGIGTLWRNFGLVTGAGTNNPLYVGANARAQYNQIFGVNSTGVPVENVGGTGSLDAHWRESMLVGELMTSQAGPGTFLPLSRITVGALADLGYQVNYNAADAYSRPATARPLVAASTSSARTALVSGSGDSTFIDLGGAVASRRVQQVLRSSATPVVTPAVASTIDAVMDSESSVSRNAGRRVVRMAAAAAPAVADVDAAFSQAFSFRLAG